MRIAVIYNEPKPAPASDHWLASDASAHGPAPDADASELGVLDQVAGIDDFLRDAGHDTTVLAIRDVASLVRLLEADRPDLIFNVCEALRGDDTLTMAVAGLFDLCGIPYTGSSALTLGLALDKSITKALFRAHGVPTPAYELLEPNTPCDLELRYPLIVKPVRADASNGITAGSVVGDAGEVARRAAFIWRTFEQPALVEEYIDGREFNVALLAASPTEWVTLPLSEITFEGFGDQPRIVCYESKWVHGSAAYRRTVPQCPAAVSDDVAAEVRAAALLAATGCFTAPEMAIAEELIDAVLTHAEQPDYHGFVYSSGERAVGLVIIGPVPATIGTWHLYWIAVHPHQHGTGVAAALAAHAESFVREHDGYLIMVETSSQPVYVRARSFYSKHGYAELLR